MRSHRVSITSDGISIRSDRISIGSDGASIRSNRAWIRSRRIYATAYPRCPACDRVASTYVGMKIASNESQGPCPRARLARLDADMLEAGEHDVVERALHQTLEARMAEDSVLGRVEGRARLGHPSLVAEANEHGQGAADVVAGPRRPARPGGGGPRPPRPDPGGAAP